MTKPAPKQQAYGGLRLNTSDKILGYVDKQVRKELFESIKTADIPLLTNFLDQFNKCLSRQDQINFSDTEKGDGNTILHSAVLMDFEEKRELIRLGGVHVDQDGTGGQDERITVDLKTIKKALSKESGKSAKIKA